MQKALTEIFCYIVTLLHLQRRRDKTVWQSSSLPIFSKAYWKNRLSKFGNSLFAQRIFQSAFYSHTKARLFIVFKSKSTIYKLPLVSIHILFLRFWIAAAGQLTMGKVGGTLYLRSRLSISKLLSWFRKGWKSLINKDNSKILP